MIAFFLLDRGWLPERGATFCVVLLAVRTQPTKKVDYARPVLIHRSGRPPLRLTAKYGCHRLRGKRRRLTVTNYKKPMVSRMLRFAVSSGNTIYQQDEQRCPLWLHNCVDWFRCGSGHLQDHYTTIPRTGKNTINSEADQGPAEIPLARTAGQMGRI